ncbi:MAG: UDP-glucose dehydrogenase family protein [Bacteroidia bacterium]|jgi:UDPglucose 6-dehydrogenase|nr:UDP-glucose/GDP-mannose dehydrogenase family protein [Bacteroidia bacterium]NBY10698.1 UDP-glucose/GDP-mannose dehydrogenase family protein [Sphingobacteriia bacterium]
MKICIVGTGYVGLVTGTCFAEVGTDVTCVDVSQEKIDNLKQGILPIYEPGLEELVHRNQRKQRLHFTTQLEFGIKDAEVVFIAVGTPPGEDGSADLSYVLQVAHSIGTYMQNPLLVVTKSTVPVGTSQRVKKELQHALQQRQKHIDVFVASNPEFLKEGAAIEDFMKPDRIVVGTDSPQADALFQKLYKPFVLNGHPILFMDIASAEMTKYAANAMLATKISFMNDIANLCERVGADVNLVRKGIGSDPRIGSKFIYPGLGYGGSCFPKDVQALIQTADVHGHPMRILKAVEQVNNDQKARMVSKIKTHFGADVSGKHILLWGLSFKPKTDDMREAPSLVIINALLACGVVVTAYDPVAEHEAKKILGSSIQYATDPLKALREKDALVIVTEWPEFRAPDFKLMYQSMKHPVIFDGRNIYDAREMRKLGFTYYGIGIPAV